MLAANDAKRTGGLEPGEGDFKKGRFNPLIILFAVLFVTVVVIFLWRGQKQDDEKLTVEQSEEQKKAIYVLPRQEQAGKWREWAQTQKSDYLREEALKQLAWARDPAGVDVAIMALGAESQPVQAMAATALAEFGSPAADKAKEPLFATFKTAGPGAKPQIGWALVVLGESRAFDDVMTLYRQGHLSQVQRLGGGVAFDPELMVRLVPLEKLASLAGDPSPAVRQLVATVLSRNADPRWTDVLIKLVQDSDPEIARQAAPGLGKIGDERARGPLLAALKTADKDSRKKYLEALRDGIGAEGLVLALDSIALDDENRAWFQRQQIFDMLQKLADPRAGDSLLKYVETKPHIHWETRAASLMAEVGDVRAVPMLARRLRMDPLKIYSDQNDYEMLLKRDDNERVVAARMLADLSVLYPDKRDWIREQSEDALIFWNHELPAPHANGLRALAAMDSRKDIAALRKWSNPTTPLPKEGQQPPMPGEWVIAQSALRYVGWLKDPPSWNVLERSLRRRPEELDVTMDGLNRGGVAILGMALRAIGVGAADGFSQWGDARAFRPLLDYIEDSKNNEQSRMSACAALAWVATQQDVFEIAKKIQEHGSLQKSDQFRRACLLQSLIERPIPGTALALLALMTPEAAVETRHQVARAIGKGGFEAEVEKKLTEMTSSEALVNDAALALILGGSPDIAARTVASYANKPKAALEELSDLWYKTFGYWSDEDLEQGRLFKYVDNATAIARLNINNTAQEWATALLMRQLDNLEYDNGPHSFTRVVLRHRLYDMARAEDAAKRDGAIRTLKFMKEQGVLLALRDEKGTTGELASQAYFEIMNPKLLAGGTIAKEQAQDDTR